MLSYGSATFEHNAMGQRVSKTVGAGTTTYDYDELGNLVGVELPAKTVDLSSTASTAGSPAR